MSLHPSTQTIRDRIRAARRTDYRSTSPPGRTTDRRGRTVRLYRYGDGPVDDEFGALTELYRTFDPEQRVAGVPPPGEDAIRRWLTAILAGHCVVAWADDRAVGQVVVVPDPPDGHELAIFVDRSYQRAGVGSALMGAILRVAAAAGLDRLHLLTENYHMVRLAERFGFAVTDRCAGQTTLARHVSGPATEASER